MLSLKKSINPVNAEEELIDELELTLKCACKEKDEGAITDAVMKLSALFIILTGILKFKFSYDLYIIFNLFMYNLK